MSTSRPSSSSPKANFKKIAEATEYISIRCKEEGEEFIGLGDQLYQSPHKTNKDKFQLSIEEDQLRHEEHYCQNEREDLFNDLQDKVKSRNSSENLEDARNRSETVTSIENVVGKTLGNLTYHHIVKCLESRAESDKDGHKTNQNRDEEKHENEGLLQECDTSQMSSGTNECERYFAILMFLIAFVLIVVIVPIIVAFTKKNHSDKNDNKSTESSAIKPLPATPQGPHNVTSIAPLIKFKKQNDNVPEFPGKMISIPFGKEGLSSNTGIQGDHIMISESGVYHVHAKIDYRPDSVLPCMDFKEQKWSFLIEVNSSVKSVNISSYVTCSQDIAGFEQTSFTGQELKLEKGDIIRIAISGNRLVYFKSHLSYFELFKTHELSEGTFANVDLLPPSAPPLNSVTKDKEVTSKMIYIAFGRREEELSSIIDIQGDRIMITDPGVYNVYAKIDFGPDSICPCNNCKEQIWFLFVEVNSSANSLVNYFRSAVPCSQVTVGFKQTSYIAFLHAMKRGDVMQVAVSGLVSFESNSSILGLTKIKNQNGPYAHVDLLPPSEPDMNNVTKEKVPEFPEQKIYIPFKRESLSSKIDIQEDRINITEPGQYYVYANIDFRPDSVRPCKDFKEQTWSFTLEVYSSDGTLKNPTHVKVTCDPESAGFEQTGFTGKLLMLESGDFLRVSISGYGLGYYKSHGAFVGLYKI